ncbi:uncharacterized protein LOC130636417 isoform X2 [Hydractinia symbiolongicarpus]|uniref:uncharacterized protein LOC130636417 isoform X2 n=1 Tax=Hydractinia symbiolongicarpus TaxID=13093 RepID=UPI0025514628|nr:uncharacterized protein LOC130636417 isoform X2 [Hydractinia symbiolongicarpus]
MLAILLFWIVTLTTADITMYGFGNTNSDDCENATTAEIKSSSIKKATAKTVTVNITMERSTATKTPTISISTTILEITISETIPIARSKKKKVSKAVFPTMSDLPSSTVIKPIITTTHKTSTAVRDSNPVAVSRNSDVGLYKIHDDSNNICFWFEAAVTLIIKYQDKDQNFHEAMFNLPAAGADINGTCFYDKQKEATIIINWNSLYKIEFGVRQDLKDWYIEYISVKIKTKDKSVFRNPKKGELQATARNAWLLRTPLNHSYLCEEEMAVNIGDIKIVIQGVKMQPFHVKDSKLEAAHVCSSTKNNRSSVMLSAIVCISSGFVLATFLTIATLCYFVKRKRTHRVYKMIT